MAALTGRPVTAARARGATRRSRPVPSRAHARGPRRPGAREASFRPSRPLAPAPSSSSSRAARTEASDRFAACCYAAHVLVELAANGQLDPSDTHDRRRGARGRKPTSRSRPPVSFSSSTPSRAAAARAAPRRRGRDRPAPPLPPRCRRRACRSGASSSGSSAASSTSATTDHVTAPPGDREGRAPRPLDALDGRRVDLGDRAGAALRPAPRRARRPARAATASARRAATSARLPTPSR